jgi:hypothetical protein
VIDTAQRLHAAGAGLVAMFLDACRDYLNGQGGGLADEATPDDAFIGFAAQYGTPAAEPSNGPHGYYTAALLESLDGGFGRLEDMHLAASRQVALATAFRQVPVFRRHRSTWPPRTPRQHLPSPAAGTGRVHRLRPRVARRRAIFSLYSAPQNLPP